MKRIHLLVLIFGVFLLCCNNNNDITLEETDGKWVNNTASLITHNTKKVSVHEGMYGTLVKVEGNCMPVIDENSTCKSYPVKRKIHIYDYATFNQAERDKNSPVFFTKIHTKLVQTVTCDNEGFFEASLPPGKYSVFIYEDSLLYASGSDGYGGLCPVQVKSSERTEINLKLDYAVY